MNYYFSSFSFEVAFLTLEVSQANLGKSSFYIPYSSIEFIIDSVEGDTCGIVLKSGTSFLGMPGAFDPDRFVLPLLDIIE